MKFNNNKKELYWYTAFLLIFFMLLGHLLFLLYSDRLNEKEKEDVSLKSQFYAQRIQENLLTKIYTVETLETMLKLTNFDQSKFSQWVPKVYINQTGIGSVQFAPDGIVSYIYPLKGNEGAIGHDLLHDSRRDDGAIETISSRKIKFIGPVTLIQNGRRAVISRKPIFTTEDGEDIFWGFGIVVVYLEDIVPEDIDQKNYSIVILGDDPDSSKTPIVYNSHDQITYRGSNYPISLPGAKWTIIINTIESKNNYLLNFTMVFVSTLVGMLFVFQNYRIYKKNEKIHVLNKTLNEIANRDYLTCLYNRRGINEIVSLNKEKYLKGYSVAMVDIDNFKSINDTYGHDIGDEVLKKVSMILVNSVSVDVIVSRIGGDEFMLLFDSSEYANTNKIMKEISGKLKEETIDDVAYTISCGIAYGKNIDKLEVVSKYADSALYNAKKNGKNSVVEITKGALNEIK